MNRKTKKGRGFSPFQIAILAISIITLLVSLFFIARYYLSAWLTSREVQGLEQIYTPSSGGSDSSTFNLPSDGMNGFASLYAENPDVIGWVKIDDTPLSYPVMQHTTENEYYLRRSFYKEYDISGIPFLDIRNDIYQDQDNMIIYGHNMKSGLMFGSLSDYQRREYFEEHPTVHFNTLRENNIYEIVAAFQADVDENSAVFFPYYNFIIAANEEEFDDFWAQVQSRAFYDTGIVPAYGDRLLTLSTCDNINDAGRFVIFARRTGPKK